MSLNVLNAGRLPLLELVGSYRKKDRSWTPARASQETRFDRTGEFRQVSGTVKR
jgi:hypothetical protein